MSSNQSNDQDRLWEQIASLFDDDHSSAVTTNANEIGSSSSSSAEPVEESGAFWEPEEQDDDPKPLREKPPASSTREETIRMIGEAIDVQTDFPGFDQLESPSYLSRDLNHLLAPEDTEEKLETQLETEAAHGVHGQNQPGRRGDQPAMPRPENFSGSPQPLGKVQPQPQQNQAPFQRPEDSEKVQQAAAQPDVPPAANPLPQPGSRAFEEAATEAETGNDEFLQEPSPRAFPGQPWKRPDPEQMSEKLSDIMKTASEDAVRASQKEKEKQEPGAESQESSRQEEESGRDSGEDTSKKPAPRNPFQSAPWEGR